MAVLCWIAIGFVGAALVALGLAALATRAR